LNSYTLEDFEREFPSERACMDWLLHYRFPEGILCVRCGKVTKHHFVEGRQSYSCQSCGHHVHPTAGTIYHKSSTPLRIWFYAVYLLVASHGKISAKELERQLKVTYKTAWRMRYLIRQRLTINEDHFVAEVEHK
jgi:transposase-like protein